MAHTAVTDRREGRAPRIWKRALSAVATTAMLASGLVAVAIAAPIVQAPAASAAPAFLCTNNALYATSTSTGTATQRQVVAGFTTNGTGPIATTEAYRTAITDGSQNQLAIGPGGTDVFFTYVPPIPAGSPAGTPAIPATVTHYTPLTDSATTVTLPPRGDANAIVGNTMGGFDPQTGRYVFGGYNTAGTQAVLSIFDPATDTVYPNVVTVTLPNTPGQNGDLAFDTAGTLYIVSGGVATGTPAQGQGQIYRVTGELPAGNTPTALTGEPLGNRIVGPGSINSMAFASNGFLYLFASGGTTGVVQVNPSNGAVVAAGSGRALTGAITTSTDFASCATPSTATGSVTVPDRAQAGDSFDVIVRGPDTPAVNPGGTATTGPTGTEAAAGPILVLPGQTVTVGLTPTAGSGTNLGSYDPSWRCVDTSSGEVVNAGFGTTASYVQPVRAAEGATVSCDFALAGGLELDKTPDVSSISAIGDVITYTFAVTNTYLAPVANVTVTDPMPGLSTLSCSAAQGTPLAAGGTRTCTATRAATAADFTASGPITNTATASGTAAGPVSVTDTATVEPDRTQVVVEPETSSGNAPGSTVTITPEASAPIQPGSIQIVGGANGGKTLTVPEGTWTVDDAAGTIVFTPNAPDSPSPAPIQYTAAGPNGIVSAPATITVTYAAEAQPHRSDDNAIGPVTVDVLEDVVGSVDETTLAIVTGPSPGDVAPTLTVPEGVWSVEDGQIVFTPNPGVTTDPAPIEYQVISTDGTPTRASVTVTFQPVANPDTATPVLPGSPATVNPLANDVGTIAPETFAFLDEDDAPIIDDATGLPATSVTIPGQGTWSHAIVDGTLVVTFTPAPGFTATPDPIGYQVAGPGPDRTPAQSTISAPYLPLGSDDEALLQPLTEPGTPVVVEDILGNDAGALVPGSVELLDEATGEYTAGPLTVAGEGTWTIVQNDDGTVDVVFTAEPGFQGDPTPIIYRVVDEDDVETTATITVTFQPVANPDQAGGFVVGSPATITPLDNDLGDLVPETFTFLDAAGNPVGALAPYTTPEGVWSAAVAGGVVTVTFTPATGYEGDPPLVRYQVADAKGALAQSSITLDYDAAGADDISLNNPIGNPVTLLDVLADDDGEFDTDTFAFDPIDGSTLNDDGSLTVPGQGTWTFVVTPAGAVNVTFTPIPGFQSDPSVVTYTVQAVGTGESTASLIVGYVQVANADQVLLAPLTEPGTATTVEDILGNDLGAFDPADVELYDPATDTWLPVGTPLVVDGEGSWEIVVSDDGETADVVFTAEAGFQGNPTPIQYRVPDLGAQGDVVQSTVTVTFQPVANDDAESGFGIGEDATVLPLANDLGAFDVASFVFVPRAGQELQADGSLVVPGEGTWTATPDAVTGVVTVVFSPFDEFEGDPSAVDYEVAGNGGVVVGATITVDYDPLAEPDGVSGLVPGTVAEVPDVLGNDAGVFDPATFAFVPAEGDELEEDGSYVVDGQGTWSFAIDEETGAVTVTFTPEPGFLSDPGPVDYVVEDLSGTETGSTITVEYLQVANPDEVLLAPLTEPGTPVDVEDILGNDLANVDLSTVQLIHPVTGELFALDGPMLVDGEGTWLATIVEGEGDEPDTITVTFTAADGFQGNPTTIGYEALDVGGDRIESTVTVTFQPVANDDAESGFGIGEDATVLPLANDLGAFDVASFVFVPRAGQELQADGSLVVPGEGTWTATPDAVTGVVTVVFSPFDEFEGDPSAVDYEVAGNGGVVVGATITVDYQPLAEDDTVTGLEPGTVATLPDVLGNDAGDLDPATFAFVPAEGDELEEDGSYVVDGQGTWSFAIDEETGVVTVTFTPEEGFLSDPTPVDYTVEDRSGSETGATLTVDYLQTAADDELLDQPITEPVTVEDILGNDVGSFVLDSVQLWDPTLNDGAGGWLPAGDDLVVAGEGTWSIVENADGTVDATFTPEEGFLLDPTPVLYQVQDAGGDLVQATITVTYLPIAVDDADLGNLPGETVTVDVLANDVGDFAPTTVVIVDGEARVTELVVEGEGTWTVDPVTGAITFVPEAGFGGDPTPIVYEVSDSQGKTAAATVTITYGVTAVDDESRGNQPGTAVTVDVVGNDAGPLDPTTVRIVSGDERLLELVVPGEGTWTVDPETGAITFTPEDGFIGNPTPITYEVSDAAGDASQAQVIITYLPTAIPDSSTGNVPGTAVTVDPLANDSPSLDPTTVQIQDPATGEWGTEVVVPGEGTWTVDPVTGEITFTPERGFTGNPTPIPYRAQDAEGNLAESTATITYDPAATAPPTPGPGTPGGPSRPGLPPTGGDVATWVLLAGLGLLVAGAATWLIRRRREDGTQA